MTVVAIHRGKRNSHNVMAVDTVCSSSDTPQTWTDKLSVIFGNTYITAVGEPDVVEALRLVVDCVEPERPNLRSPDTIASVVGLVERIWLLRERDGQPRHHSNGSVLFVCTRHDVFFWLLEYDDGAQRFIRPTAPNHLGEGDCVVFWGSDRYDLSAAQLADASLDLRLKQAPHEGLIEIIGRVDAEARARGKRGLRYPLSPPFSSVVVPHKPSLPPRRVRPFAPPELIVRQLWPQLLAILEEDDFRDFSLPPTT